MKKSNYTGLPHLIDLEKKTRRKAGKSLHKTRKAVILARSQTPSNYSKNRVKFVETNPRHGLDFNNQLLPKTTQNSNKTEIQLHHPRSTKSFTDFKKYLNHLIKQK